MGHRVLFLTLLAWSAHASDACPASFPTPVRSAALALSPTTHRVLLRESNASYTAVETANSPPYNVIRTIPNFARQLTTCWPAAAGLYSYFFNVTAVAQLGSGGYILAMAGPYPTIEIAVFDAGLNLVSEAQYSDITPVAFADLNGDGKLDMIGTTLQDHLPALAVSLGNGGASFQPPVIYPTGAPVAQAVAVADLNGDHKPDIVTITAINGAVVVFLGNGDGTFQAPKIVANSGNSSPVGALAVADLNGDGKPDLVFITGDQPPALHVALGVGDGTFTTPVTYPVAASDSVAIGDVNGDGIPDIVTDGITILFGDGKGAFPNRRDYAAPIGNDGNDVILTDFDGDGITDIVVAGVGNPAVIMGDSIAVISGLGKGEFAAPQVSLIAHYGAVDTVTAVLLAADLNGDGLAGIVSADNMGDVTVLKGNGDGSFQSTSQFTFASGLIPNAAIFADVNHDGIPDLVIVGSGYTPSSTGLVEIRLGNGDGTFQSPNSVPAPLGAFALAAEDFNGDGKTDLAVLISQAGAGPSDGVSILLGKGDGTFAEGATYAVGPFAQSFAVGDFNADGKLDLVVAGSGTYAVNYADGNLMLLTGNGDGTFAARPVPLTGAIGSPYAVVAADFNRDGRLDLALALTSRNGGRLVTMLGRGDGTFDLPVSYPVGTYNLQAADVNGDGILDLVLDTSYMLGNRDGTFQPPVSFPFPGFPGGDNPIALADFNHDGKIDVVSEADSGIFTLLNGTQPAPPVTVVNSASFTPGPVAADSIVTAFGNNLPAPGAAVSIVDATGTSFHASVLYDSPSQINFVMPAGVDAGPAAVTIGGGSAAQSAAVVIAPAAESLFTLNQSGLAAAYVTNVATGGTLTNEPVFNFQNGIYTPRPIDVSSGEAYLILFGTGIRNAGSVQVTVEAPALGAQVLFPSYAGPQPTFQGLDQVNVLLPASLAESGCVEVWVGPTGSNIAYVCIQ